MLKRFMGTVDEDPIYHKRAAKNTPFETVQIRFPSQRPGMMNVPHRGRRRSLGPVGLSRLSSVAGPGGGHRSSG